MITKELLIANGFTEKPLPYFKDEKEVEYVRDVPLLYSDEEYHLSVTSYSNTVNRDWCLHVDNECFSTSGMVDIQTIYHFNTFMELLDIDFKLKKT